MSVQINISPSTAQHRLYADVFMPGDEVEGTVVCHPPQGFTGDHLESMKVSLTAKILSLNQQSGSNHNSNPASSLLDSASSSTTGSHSRSRRFTQSTFLNTMVWSSRYENKSGSFGRSEWKELATLLDVDMNLVSTHSPNLKSSPSKQQQQALQHSFSIPLRPKQNPDFDRANDLKEIYGIDARIMTASQRTELLDSYHGQNVDVVYIMKAVATFRKSSGSQERLSFFEKVMGSTGSSGHGNLAILQDECEVFVRNLNSENDSNNQVPYPFVLSEDISSKEGNEFSMHGYIDNISISPNDPITGWYQVEKGGSVISSVEVRLNRIETVESNSAERTEIMKLEFADGPIFSDSRLPIFITPHPFLVCPGISENNKFSISFELVISVKLDSLTKITSSKTIPLQYRRCFNKEPTTTSLFGLCARQNSR